MKYLNTTLILLGMIGFYSCSESETENKSEDEIETTMEPAMDVVEEDNALQMRNEIEDYRQTIENTKAELAKGTIDLSAARAEISQDWQKLDFYKSGDKVVRIKTYPTTEIGSKTEEFYFIDDELVFALVENEGTEKDAMDNEVAGEAFYYSNGELIVSADFEMSKATEKERSEMKLGTKLQNEAEGYLELIYNSKD